MLRISICDDKLQELSRISDLLSQYTTEKNTVIKQDAFLNSIDLLEAMKRQAYDVLILDVLMPGINGITTAQEVRSFDSSVKVIFFTASPEFAVESYAVNAYYYLLKPVTADKLFPVLDRILLEKHRSECTLSIVQSSGLIRLPLERIEFVEVSGKMLMFHFDDGTLKEIRGSISEFEDRLLCRNNFFKVHRSYIVNMEYIQSINAKEITTYSGHAVPISRLLHGEVKEAYMRFLFLEKGVY